jgi:hypothetical protein
MTKSRGRTATNLYAHTIAADQLRSLRDEDDVAKRLDTLNVARSNVDFAMREEVSAWREAGASWAQVGEALGLTRQGAQQRYGGH